MNKHNESVLEPLVLSSIGRLDFAPHVLFCSVLSHPRFEGRPHNEQMSSNVSCPPSVLSFLPLSIQSILLHCPTSLFSVFLCSAFLALCPAWCLSPSIFPLFSWYVRNKSVFFLLPSSIDSSPLLPLPTPNHLSAFPSKICSWSISDTSSRMPLFYQP